MALLDINDSVIRIGIFLLVLLVITLVILFIAIPVKMAKKRGRSQFGWGLAGFIGLFSVFIYAIVIIVLLCLGETYDKRRERVEEEEEWRRSIRERQ